MKKLLTFAGVSALALVTAAPNAFGSAGTYAPSCSANAVTITFWGIDGTDLTKVKNLGSASYKSGNWYKTGSSTVATKFSDLGVTIPDISKSISLNSITATEGAKPFRADLMGSEPTSVQADSLIGTTTCASAAPADSIGVVSNDTLPTISADTIGNHTSLNYVVMYAANCVDSQTATCKLTVGSKKATYTNSCNQGFGDPNFLQNTMVCADSMIPVEMPSNPEAPAI